MIAPDTSQQKGREPQDRTDITFEQERMVELPDVYRTYLQYFQQYAANTDGKQAIAEAVLRLPCAKQMALDLGAGDGRITRHLARHFERVIAVETNPLNEPLLTSIGDNVEVHIRDMRELDFKPFDLAIMAYSFPTDSKGKLEDFIAQLTAHRKKGGFIVAVSYAEGCPWDRYAEFVSKKLGITRTGGSAELIRRIKSVGFESRV
ncbi:MAG: class I SAM-dependent methyltransferase, partial [Candidatus Dadabacteria bacterium]